MPVFKQRRGTAAALAAANETPSAGQIYFETDTNRLKVGDGIRAYNSLPYLATSVGIVDVVGLTSALAGKQAAGSYAATVHAHTAAQISDFAAQAALYGPVTSVNGQVGAVTTVTAWADITGKPSTFTPTAHVHSANDVTSGTFSISRIPLGTTSSTVCVGNDSRLSDSRAPLAHTQAWSTITSTPTTVGGYGITDAVLASDSRLTDARVPSGAAGGDLTGTYPSPSLAASGVTAGTYTSVTVDSKGRVTAGTTPAGYSLPVATATVLGGVKIGSGISIDGSGVISASAGYTLPNATTTTLGGVIVGTGIAVASGVVSVTYGTAAGTACEGNDARLADARTPTSHAASHGTGGADAISPASIGAAASSHTHTSAAITDFVTAVVAAAPPTTDASLLTAGTLADARLSANVVFTADARLSDSRTPTSHTHSAGDIVSGTVASARLGSGTADATTFLRGDGQWAVPAGGGGGGSFTGGTLTSALLVIPGAAATPGLAISGDSNTGLYQDAADTISVAANGSEIARFGGTRVNVTRDMLLAGTTSVISGNAGIIFASGTNHFRLAGNTTSEFTIARVSSLATTPDEDACLRIVSINPADTRAQAQVGAFNSATFPQYAFLADTNTGITNPSADSLSLVTGGSDRVRIDSSGRVGIGITSPTQPLDVNGTARVTSLTDGTTTKTLTDVLAAVGSSPTQAGGGTAVTNVIVMTTAAYSALATKDPNTLYFVT